MTPGVGEPFPGVATAAGRPGARPGPGLVEAVRAVAAGEVSSRELVRLALDRIAAASENAVVTVAAERALGEAARRDEDLMADGPVGPLHGVPFTVKDAIATAGIRSTAGAPELGTHVPAEEAPAVRLLRAAGAVLVGKTNCSPWSSDLETRNPVFGVTRNPWDPARTPGGSSGGSAAAIATGLSAFDLGTDIGGSVRIPPAFCGVFGLKPTYGLVPAGGYLDTPAGAADPGPEMNVFGPIGHSAADLGVVLDVLAAPSGGDEAAWSVALPRARPDIPRGLRVAVLDEHPVTTTDPAVVAAVGRVTDRLADAGAIVSRPAPPVPLDEIFAGFGTTLRAQTVLSHPDAAPLPVRDLVASQRERARQRAAWAEWFTRVDVLLCPAVPTLAFPHDGRGRFRDRMIHCSDGVDRPGLVLTSWTGLASSLYLPALVFPAEVHRGLPVGVQLVGPRFAEHTLVALAEVCTR
ncbi:amidase family protein [Pseudonocardia sp. NPDC049154]|uniref:amidase family protein n=1 Tax=Pseudonocardia sp. NPDC049154 TaxID=3155501 RepID=UPI0033E22FC4